MLRKLLPIYLTLPQDFMLLYQVLLLPRKTAEVEDIATVLTQTKIFIPEQALLFGIYCLN